MKKAGKKRKLKVVKSMPGEEVKKKKKVEKKVGEAVLSQLKKYTTIVSDTGDFNSIKEFKPIDATTNPSLILQAANNKKYSYLIDEAVSYGLTNFKTGKPKIGNQFNPELLELICDRTAVNFGEQLLNIIPGYVSTEADARLSFDPVATIRKAKKLIRMYKEKGIDKKRILIKIAATWEGVEAARVLQKQGIQCNMTLLFGFCQAIACAEANATLISPFVGRILDWFKQKYHKDYTPEEEPGVTGVTEIYNYYKKFGHKTIVMGASFRNIGEIIELAGCDRLTISPALLQELQETHQKIKKKLDKSKAKKLDLKKISLDEKNFRWMLNEDAMATEKLSEGIRKFAEDTEKLEGIIKERLESALKKEKKKKKK